jgi:uracil-DNA glycosylase
LGVARRTHFDRTSGHMDTQQYRLRAETVRDRLRQHPRLALYVDAALEPPIPFGPPSGARLVILGQDPTVKREASRRGVRVVLNLDRPGSLRTYLAEVCSRLDVDIDREVYALNLSNNFFTAPPASLEPWVLKEAAEVWAPLVQEQLADHPAALVIVLGEPLLAVIAMAGTPSRLRTYWGYAKSDVPGVPASFAALAEDQNLLRRPVYPFPHAPSRGRYFYRSTLPAYTRFAAAHLGPTTPRID